jgi:uncharacterized protein (TIGR02268 family)
LGTAARAQPSPAREQRQRSVTLTGNPADPPHEIRAAKGVATVLIFKSQINGNAVEVDRTRVKILDAGEWSIIFELVLDLGLDERLVLGVPFADGQRAVFVLVSSPSEVDTRIDVVRREQTVEACHAEVCAGMRGPEDFLLLGYMDGRGVPTAQIRAARDSTHGIESERGVAYRGNGWLMFQIRIRNTRGPRAWVPTEATLTGKTGEQLRGRVVLEEQGEPAPGAPVRVLVVTEEPPPSAGLAFTLEVSAGDGRILVIPIEAPAPAEEPKR